jgi:hypothetical protein
MSAFENEREKGAGRRGGGRGRGARGDGEGDEVAIRERKRKKEARLKIGDFLFLPPRRVSRAFCTAFSSLPLEIGAIETSHLERAETRP